MIATTLTKNVLWPSSYCFFFKRTSFCFILSIIDANFILLHYLQKWTVCILFFANNLENAKAYDQDNVSSPGKGGVDDLRLT